MTWPGDLIDRLKAAQGAEALRARAQGVRERFLALALAAQDDVVQVVELRCGEVGCP